MKAIIQKSLMATLVVAALAGLSVQPATAAVAYNVTAITPPDPSGAIEFQLNPGVTPPGALPLTATISNLMGGTANGTPTNTGNVTGALPGTVTLVNSTAFNDYFQGVPTGSFSYGTSLSFVLVLSGPAIDMPDPTKSRTTFCLSLWADAAGTIPLLPQDPFGCNLMITVTNTGAIIVVSTGVVATPAVVPVANSYQVGYAANLNIGDSVVNLTNSGTQGGSFGAGTTGNICVNVYAFDPQEEEIACCACLVTPNGLNSLSAQQDLISNTLTPARPTSITVTLIASQPGVDPTGGFTICNPASVTPTGAAIPFVPAGTGSLAAGLGAWGTTLEPSGSAGTYNAVPVPFLNGGLSTTQLSGLTTLCNFTQANGTGYGICKSCRLGALGGAKQ